MEVLLNFLQGLHARSAPLFVFGLLNLLLAIVCIALSRVVPIELVGTNA